MPIEEARVEFGTGRAKSWRGGLTRRQLLVRTGAAGIGLAAFAAGCAPTVQQVPVSGASASPRLGGTLAYAQPESVVAALNSIPVNNVSNNRKVMIQGNLYETLYRATANTGLKDWLA